MQSLILATDHGVHQGAFAGGLWASDGNNLVVCASLSNPIALYEVLEVVIETALLTHQL